MEIRSTLVGIYLYRNQEAHIILLYNIFYLFCLLPNPSPTTRFTDGIPSAPERLYRFSSALWDCPRMPILFPRSLGPSGWGETGLGLWVCQSCWTGGFRGVTGVDSLGIAGG